MSTKPINTKIARLTIPIATAYRTIRNSALLYFLIAFAGPFLHLFGDPEAQGPFHWRWMISFLDAFGWALFPLFMGLGLLSLSKKLPVEFKNVFQSIAFVCISIGGFYVAYCLIPIRDFTNTQYYFMLTFIGILTSVSCHFLMKMANYAEEKLKAALDRLITFIVQAESTYVKNDKRETYFKDYIEQLNQINKKL
ncbi:MAG: hypothetical protein CMC74_12160 [Flavobacteriaceae bacterium]|nr:hypothetical protein [Flavobacteriaceae bacterium]|tara:strand:- start:986 stop:1570 length:585 start_codon:yes stop_codon:yes gene_type:complete